jgi:hypothetical protein
MGLRVEHLDTDVIRSRIQIAEWPNPGRSMATTRPTPDTRSQMRRKAQRLSGHGASSSTMLSASALVSANRTRTPSQTRK